MPSDGDRVYSDRLVGLEGRDCVVVGKCQYPGGTVASGWLVYSGVINAWLLECVCPIHGKDHGLQLCGVRNESAGETLDKVMAEMGLMRNANP